MSVARMKWLWVSWVMKIATYDPAWWVKQVAFRKDWFSLVSQRTAEPTTYDTQPTYEVLEYTYWTTKYYRTVYNTYDPNTDAFYTDPTLTVLVASRALSL